MGNLKQEFPFWFLTLAHSTTKKLAAKGPGLLFPLKEQFIQKQNSVMSFYLKTDFFLLHNLLY